MQMHKIREAGMKRLPESELEVMMCIWRMKGKELSVSNILEELRKDRAITAGALHSYLSRLTEKKCIRCEKYGKYRMIKPLISEEEYRDSEGETVLDKFFHGSVSSLVSCLYRKNRLDANEIKELKEFVKRLENQDE